MTANVKIWFQMLFNDCKEWYFGRIFCPHFSAPFSFISFHVVIYLFKHKSWHNWEIKTGSGGVCCQNARGGACEIGSQFCDALFAQVRVQCDNKPRQIGVNHNYNMSFFISIRECQYPPHKIRILCTKREPFRVLLPLLRHVLPLNHENCHLAMPVGKGRCASDALTHTFNSGVFKSVENNSIIIKYIYNESGNTIEGCNVVFDASNCWNFPLTVPGIGIESRVTRARLRYTRYYLTPGICSLTNSSPWTKWLPFHRRCFQCIFFLNEKFCIQIKISLKFVPKGPIDNNLALLKKMAWRRTGDKPLSEEMLTRFTNACMWR